MPRPASSMDAGSTSPADCLAKRHHVGALAESRSSSKCRHPEHELHLLLRVAVGQLLPAADRHKQCHRVLPGCRHLRRLRWRQPCSLHIPQQADAGGEILRVAAANDTVLAGSQQVEHGHGVHAYGWLAHHAGESLLQNLSRFRALANCNAFIFKGIARMPSGLQSKKPAAAFFTHAAAIFAVTCSCPATSPGPTGHSTTTMRPKYRATTARRAPGMTSMTTSPATAPAQQVGRPQLPQAQDRLDCSAKVWDRQ
jgi:hypothetical protein